MPTTTDKKNGIFTYSYSFMWHIAISNTRQLSIENKGQSLINVFVTFISLEYLSSVALTRLQMRVAFKN